MSVDIVIKQKGFLKKPYPNEVIVGDALSYGVYEAGFRLAVGEMGDEFTLFHPSHIARGITVTRMGGSKLALRALTPTTEAELRDLYDTVARIMNYRSATLEVDGTRMSLDEFLGGFSEAVDFNARALRHFAEECLPDAEAGTFFSAKWPLAFGKQEAEKVLADPEFFPSWLHKKQNLDVYFAVPQFFEASEGGILGVYELTENCRSIFPHKASVPFGINDPATGAPLTCERFELSLYSTTRGTGIGTVPYDRLLDLLDPAKVSYYDAESVLVEPLTLREMETLVDRASS